MRRWLGEKLQIKPGEGTITLLMFLCIFSIMTFYYILKPLRSGLFLKNFPASQLPYAYFITALLAGTLATLIFKLSRRLSTISLLTGTYFVIIATLLYFRWAMGRNIFYLPYIYYVYVQIVSVLATTEFWLLAGFILDHRQSKRIFPLLGGGAIIGAMAGSFIPGFLSERLSTQSMLLICIGLCVFIIGLSHVVWHNRRPDAERGSGGQGAEESRERLSVLFRLVFGSRHLLLITALVFLSLIASQICDWQVNAAAQIAYQDLPKGQMEAAISALFGRFYFVTNILGVILQLTVTGFVISRFGIGASILFLPAGLLFSSIGVFAVPALWTTVISLGGNSVFRYSINRVGMEVLYLPLSREMRKKVKIFIDVFIDRFGRAVAGVIILALTGFNLSLGLRGTALAIIVISCLCVVTCLMLRKSYVEIFRAKLARGEVDLTEVGRYLTDPRLIRLLVQALDSPHERRILYALGLLQAVRGFDFADQLLPLLRHKSSAVRAEALRTLPALTGNYVNEAQSLIADPSEEVRLAAIDYFCRHDPEKANERTETLLNHPDLDMRLSAMTWAAGIRDVPFQPSAAMVRRLLTIDGPMASRAKVTAAKTAARLPALESIALLRKLIKDADLAVARAAILAAGGAGHKEMLFDLLPMLMKSDTRGAARQALLLFGPGISGTLGDTLCDKHSELALRREIPWILGHLETARAADALVESLDAEDPRLKYNVLIALSNLHARVPALPIPGPRIAERIHAEARAYYEVLALSQSLEEKSDGQSILLGKVLRERLDQNLQIIFKLLGLRYSQRDMDAAYVALKSTQSDRRTSAVEFLDNILDKNQKPMILPLLEESSSEKLVVRAQRLFGIQVSSRLEALRLILRQGDPWLKACALNEAGNSRIVELTDELRTLANDPEPTIREMVQWAAKRCA
jgi:ATP:ADP antiporter, AAA family